MVLQSGFPRRSVYIYPLPNHRSNFYQTAIQSPYVTLFVTTKFSSCFFLKIMKYLINKTKKNILRIYHCKTILRANKLIIYCIGIFNSNRVIKNDFHPFIITNNLFVLCNFCYFCLTHSIQVLGLV